MGGQSGLSELFVISWVSTVEGCPLGEIPLYISKIFSLWDFVMHFLEGSRGMSRKIL